ncbi:MAG: HupU protein [Magnetospirillum sp.]|nr:HupU protein [Magnetospirillum sp.]
MSITVYWLSAGGCGGDTMSFLGADSPDVVELFAALDVDVLWHPSLSTLTAAEHETLLGRIRSGRQRLDVLIVEGAVIRGPSGTGLYDGRHGKPKKDLVAALAGQAGTVVAAGTCASFGGFGVGKEIEATGLQFQGRDKGGFLGEGFRSGSGLPVINLAGCPCHPQVMAGALSALAAGVPLRLDEFNRPLNWFGVLVHQGCSRNEYHEYRVEEEEFGQKGCLFFHMGCHGPLVPGPCNKLLWNNRSSKPRAGVPCFGCTDPGFPQKSPFFLTPNIEGVPLALPSGVSRAHYLVYKGMAAAAAPDRLKKRETGV